MGDRRRRHHARRPHVAPTGRGKHGEGLGPSRDSRSRAPRKSDQLAVDVTTSRMLASHSFSAAVGDGVEDRLHIRRRLADHAQDLAGRVCCSSASVSSRLRLSSSPNSRTFSIAMTAWSAKVCSSGPASR